MIPPAPGPGSEMLIACWHCGLCLLFFRVREGTHTLSCSKCSLATSITVCREGSAWRIRSGPVTAGA
jgi:hypothetical protein